MSLSFLIIVFINVYAKIPENIKVGIYFGPSAPNSADLEFDGQQVTVNKADVTEELIYTSKQGLIKVNNTEYRGNIIINKDKENNLIVINEVDLEDYVASVIAKEMSPGFETEALKAQAVCARTYAAANIGKHSQYGFDVCATIHCQVYGGTACEHEKTTSAAQQTSGEILTYNDEIIEAVYFATSGGHTESSEYVWGSQIPYLKGVNDKYESSECYGSRWTKEVSPERIGQIMADKGYQIGNVKDIEILKKTPDGVVYELSVIGDKGEKVFKNESCRTFLGDILLSQAYTVNRSSKASITTYSGKANPEDVYILSADGTVKLNGDSLYLMGTQTIHIDIPESSGNFVFNGRGYGHLVGMSQNGANSMAKAGFTYDDILKHYYTGTEIAKIEH